jgi:hypothetical protein
MALSADYTDETIEALAKLTIFVTPAKAGVHNTSKRLDSGFRRNDAEGLLQEAPLIALFFVGARTVLKARGRTGAFQAE